MTMRTELEKIDALLPDFQYVDRDANRIVVTVGFVATFYFWGGHTAAKRLALADCVEAFEAAYGNELTWACDPHTWKTVKLPSRQLPTFRAYVRPMDEDDQLIWYVSSGDDRDAVGDFAACCMAEQGWNNGKPSCFQFHVPRDHAFDSDKRVVLEALLAICIERLAPFHGNAGLGAITIEQRLTWEPELLDLATRYSAVQIEDIVSDRRQAPNGPKGVNWLTYIGDLLTEKLGGPAAFARHCQRCGVDTIRSANGFMLRAGATPQLGLVSEPPPEAYVRINACIRPLRNARFGSMGTGSVNGELRFDRCTSDLWIRRFDAPGIWPPASFAGLPRGPVGCAPSSQVTLQTGQTCVVHGRYRLYPADPALFDPDEECDRSPMVNLLPGDVAPFHLTLGPHGEFMRRDAVAWELTALL